MTAIMMVAGARKIQPAALCFATRDMPLFLEFTGTPPFKPLKPLHKTGDCMQSPASYLLIHFRMQLSDLTLSS